MKLVSPHLYINLHQTIWVLLATGVVVAYIYDFKGFRTAINSALVEASIERKH